MFQSSGRRHVARVACVNYFQMSVLAWDYSWEFQLQHLLKEFSASLNLQKIICGLLRHNLDLLTKQN